MAYQTNTSLDSRASAFDAFRKKALFVTKLSLSLSAVVLMLYFGQEVLLMAFAGILFAIMITSVASFISRHSPLNYRWSWVATIIALLVTAIGSSMMMVPSISEQASELAARIPTSIARFETELSGTEWGTRLLQRLQPSQLFNRIESAAPEAAMALMSFVSAFAGVLVILFVSLYGSFDPGLYRRGFMHLVPIPKRERADEVLNDTTEALRWWFLGRLVSMTVVGLMTGVGLWLLGVPLALVLGIIAGVLDFVPNFGPVAAAIPALLLAWSMGPQTVLYVAGLYLIVQMIEGYLITPLVQQRTVEIPPVLIITFQVFFGLALGVLGVILATPLTVALLVLIRKLYVEDTLHDQAS